MGINRLPLLITATLQFTTRFGMNFLLQFRLRELNAPLFIVGLLLSIRGGISVLMSPLWGSASDRKGKRKVVILVSVLGSAVSMPLYLFSSQIWQVISVASLVAFFSSGFNPVAMALSSEYSSKESSQARELSLLNSSNSLGMLLSRLLIGISLIHLTVRSAMNFFIFLAIFSVIPAFFVREVPESIPSSATRMDEKNSKVLEEITKMMGRKGLWAIYLSSFLRQFGTSGTLSLSAIYLAEKMGMDKSTIGFISAMNPAFQIPAHMIFAKIIERTNPKLVAIVGMLLSSGVAFIFLIGKSTVEIGMAYILLGIAFGAFINGVAVLITRMTTARERAQALGLLNSSRQIGFMMGPMVSGILATISYNLLFLTMALVMLMGSAVMMIFSAGSDAILKKR